MSTSPGARHFDLVQSIASSTGLLHQGLTMHARLLNTFTFTTHCARALRTHGFGLLLQRRGLNVDQLAIDRIVNRHTGEVVVIVEYFCTPRAAACWSESAARASELYVDASDPAAAFTAESREQKTIAEVLLEIKTIRDSVDAAFDRPPVVSRHGTHGVRVRRS